jgi:hypothetical protein
MFKGHAVVDAYQHCAETGHQPLGPQDICVSVPPMSRDSAG